MVSFGHKPLKEIQLLRHVDAALAKPPGVGFWGTPGGVLFGAIRPPAFPLPRTSRSFFKGAS